MLSPRLLAGVLLLSSLSLRAAVARADDGAAPAVTAPDLEPPALVSHWYGGGLLAADVASVALVVASGPLRSTPLAVVGAAGWLLGSPILHTSHAGLGRGAASLALRIGLPLVSFLVAQQATQGCWRETGASDTCDIGTEATAMVLGALAAEVIDVAWLARDSHPAERRGGGGERAFAQPGRRSSRRRRPDGLRVALLAEEEAGAGP